MRAKKRTAKSSTPARPNPPEACPLSRYKGIGSCVWCGKDLSGRQTRWCSPACSMDWARNHMWTEARKASRRRDKYACLECGVTEGDHNAERRGWQAHEVDHVVRAFGKHTTTSCIHHLDNLRTLCHPCHVAKTRADRVRDGR